MKLTKRQLIVIQHVKGHNLNLPPDKCPACKRAGIHK